MIVPQFWAEALVPCVVGKRSKMVRRFGWSDQSQADADRMAQSRAQEAAARLSSGERLPPREPKVPYNGAEGVPIREEILGRYGNMVLTRNSYGARCLNSPNALFVDIDFASVVPLWFIAMFAVLCDAVVAIALVRLGVRPRAIVSLLFFGSIVGMILGSMLYRLGERLMGGAEARARKRIQRFIDSHHDWLVRLYRTPAGFRVLAMHRVFDPGEEEVAECFTALGADPQYARMCRRQNCFRARVSPKPWRIGIATHMRPRPGVWPVSPDRLPERSRWIQEYEAKATGFASCRFIEELGMGSSSYLLRDVQKLHDEWSQAHSGFELA